MISDSPSGRSKGERLDSAVRGDHEEDEAGEAPGREDEPVRQDAGVAGLLVDDGDGGERAGGMMTDDRGEDQRNFVADHLGDGAHGAEQRVLVAARPAGHEDGEFDDRADGEEEQHAGVQVDEHHVAADGQHGVGQEGRDDQQRPAPGSGRPGPRCAGRCLPW